MVEQYAKTMNIELNLMIDLFQTQILPAAQKDFILRGMQQKFAPIVESAMEMAEELKTMQGQLFDLGWEAKGKVFAELLSPKMEAFRERVDQLEKVVDNTLWPLPKYRELLYLI